MKRRNLPIWLIVLILIFGIIFGGSSCTRRSYEVSYSVMEDTVRTESMVCSVYEVAGTIPGGIRFDVESVPTIRCADSTGILLHRLYVESDWNTVLTEASEYPIIVNSVKYLGNE